MRRFYLEQPLFGRADEASEWGGADAPSGSIDIRRMSLQVPPMWRCKAHEPSGKKGRPVNKWRAQAQSGQGNLADAGLDRLGENPE